MKKVILAREAQAKLAHPTDEKFKIMVSSKSLDKYPVKPQHITDAKTIFGPSRPGLRGGNSKTVPRKG